MSKDIGKQARASCPLRVAGKSMVLMTMADNRKYSRHAVIRETGYKQYDNFPALEVPYVDAIPYDYDGIMGVPITIFDKINPDYYEIVGIAHNGNPEYDDLFEPIVDGKRKYARILIRRTEWFTDMLRLSGMIECKPPSERVDEPPEVLTH